MMLYHGYITQEECDLAKSIKVEDLLIDAKSTINTDYTYQAYIDAALKEAREVTGLDPMNVSMEIHTNMNPTVQAQLESIQAGTGGIDFPDDLYELGSTTKQVKSLASWVVETGQAEDRCYWIMLPNSSTNQVPRSNQYSITH